MPKENKLFMKTLSLKKSPMGVHRRIIYNYSYICYCDLPTINQYYFLKIRRLVLANVNYLIRACGLFY